MTFGEIDAILNNMCGNRYSSFFLVDSYLNKLM